MEEKIEDYFIAVNDTSPDGIPYKSSIKKVCLQRFLSAEENWEALYDLLVVTKELELNNLKVIKDGNGFVTDVFFDTITVNDDIIVFAFNNIWKYAQMKEKTKLSDKIIIRTRRDELKKFILNYGVH